MQHLPAKPAALSGLSAVAFVAATLATIVLGMTGNKTVFAHSGTYDMTWASTSSGDWNDPSNWSPRWVPSTNDNVLSSGDVTVTLNNDTACGSLILGSEVASPTLTGSGNLTLHRSSSWTGGTMGGSGRTVVPAGVTLAINNRWEVILENRTLNHTSTSAIVRVTDVILLGRVRAIP